MMIIQPIHLTPEQMDVLEDATEDYGYFSWAVGYVRGLYPDLPYEQQKKRRGKPLMVCLLLA